MTTKGNYLGEFEELVLLSVAALGDDAYGVSILQYIEQEAGRSVNISAVHEVLKRMQKKGYVKSKMGGATQERGGRRKRFFSLTVGGRKVLEEAMKLKLQLYKQVPNLSFKLGLKTPLFRYRWKKKIPTTANIGSSKQQSSGESRICSTKHS